MKDDIFGDMASLLRSAIKSEIDGFTYYDLLAKEAANKEAIRRLENLRNDEARHRAILTNLFKKHIGGEIGALPSKGISPLEAAFVGGKLKKLNSEIEYINLAMKAEQAAVEFYRHGAGAIQDTGFRDILNGLAEEENGHFEILMAEREAISGNYYWFSSDGTSPMED